MPSPRINTNAHIHLFGADHVPSAQLYYLFRGALHDAATELLEEHMTVDAGFLASLDRSMDRFASPWPFLFTVAETMPFIDVSRMITMFEMVSRTSRAAARTALGVDSNERAAAMLSHLKNLTLDFQGQGQDYPFRLAMCKVVNDLFAAHTEGVDAKGPMSQRDIWRNFLDKTPGAKRYDRVVVLTINFDDAFLHDVLPGLTKLPKISFDRQVAELADLAADVNRQSDEEGSVRMIPFLGVDPNPHVSDTLLRFVKKWVGQDKPYKGLKIYPPMGISPADNTLAATFNYCQDRGLPVVSHCSLGGAGVRGIGRNYSEYANPARWEEVLQRLELRHESGETDGAFLLCLAHFDRLEARPELNWCDEIANMMQRYDGAKGVEVFSDIAFDYVRGDKGREQYFANVCDIHVRGIADRVLYGSDWWNYLYKCDSETAFVDQLNIDAQAECWWRKSDFDAASARFLRYVV